MMEVNVYDFDKTIYNGDSTLDFYKFCIKKSKLVLFSLPITGVSLLLYIFGIYSKTKFKEKFWGFLKYIGDIDGYISEFWSVNYIKINKWYHQKHKDSDVVISASPEFLLLPICKSLNIRLIASRVEKKSGKYTGENCFAIEKTNRFNIDMPNCRINEFYSDSISDNSLAKLAQNSYFVTGATWIEWSQYKPSTLQIIKTLFLTKEFLLFIFCGGMGTLSNFIFSLIISTRLNSMISYIIGYLLSLFVAYYFNSFLIFKKPLHLGMYLKFILSYIPNFLILVTFVYLFLNIFLWNKVLVYASAGLLGIPLTYVLVKIYAFSNNRKNGG